MAFKEKDWGLIRLFEWIKDYYNLFREEKFFKIIGVTSLIIMYGALAIFFADRYYQSKGSTGILEAIYWAVVTITTVGYGDIVPSSGIGKVFALMIILSGPALLSLLTASIASIFVERKIREGKGLEAIKDRDHIIICGWNENGERVITGVLSQYKTHHPKIVLVNELDRDEVQSIQYKYKDYHLSFVRGNFVKESVLDRANLGKAQSAIVLADISGGHSLEKADERTIFGTMTIKSMSSKIRTCAELIHEENREHLIRANVDEIIVRGESAGSLLATAAVAPGIVDLIKIIINNQDENRLWRVPVPSKYEGKTYQELSSYLKDRFGAVLLALVREEEAIKLEDILSEDSTFIDEFIKRKFEESGKDYFAGKKDINVLVNPPNDYELGPRDWLVALSKERPN